MSKKIKLAILRARHNLGSQTPNQLGDKISDQACIETLMTSQARRSVLNYWSDNTEGYLDFVDSAMFPWVDITFAATDVDANNMIPRDLQLSKAYAATKAVNGNQDLTGFDGFVLITQPGQLIIPNPMPKPGQPSMITISFDGGTGSNLLGKGACALPVISSDHTFMCHEVGHVLGFAHSYGVWNNGIEWDGKPPWDQGQVYGDPYDIMSSASFGTRNVDPTLSMYTSRPTFAGVSAAGWPVQPNLEMGPAPSRSQVHLWNSDAIAANTIRHLRNVGFNPISVRLYAAGSRRGSPRVVIIHPNGEDAAGRGRCYLEYRDTSGWDAGLDVSGTDLARRAVVAHVLADATNDGVRTWYRGRIIVPLEIDSDLAVAGTPYIVRLTGDDVDKGYVDIDVSTANSRGLDVLVKNKDEIIGSTETNDTATPCGDAITWGTWITRTHSVYELSAYGYGGEGAPDAQPPRITWTVGGTVVAAAAGSVNATMSDGTMFQLNYELNQTTGKLLLSSRGGEKYTVPIMVTVAEPNGTNPTSIAKIFEALGYYTGYRPGDLAKLDDCMNKYLRNVRLRPYELLIPPGPDPFRAELRNRINQGRIGEVIRRVSTRFPAQADALKSLNTMRFGGMR